MKRWRLLANRGCTMALLIFMTASALAAPLSGKVVAHWENPVDWGFSLSIDNADGETTAHEAMLFYGFCVSSSCADFWKRILIDGAQSDPGEDALTIGDGTPFSLGFLSFTNVETVMMTEGVDLVLDLEFNNQLGQITIPVDLTDEMGVTFGQATSTCIFVVGNNEYMVDFLGLAQMTDPTIFDPDDPYLGFTLTAAFNDANWCDLLGRFRWIGPHGSGLPTAPDSLHYPEHLCVPSAPSALAGTKPDQPVSDWAILTGD